MALSWSCVPAFAPTPTGSVRVFRATYVQRSAHHDSFAAAYWDLGRYGESLEAAQRLVSAQPTYFPGYAYIAMNAVALGRLEEARAAITEGRRVQPDLSLDLMQNYFGVSRPAIDARRNAALREAGLE